MLKPVPLLTLVDGRTNSDCGIVALASWLADYDTARKAAEKEGNDPLKTGMYCSEVIRAARRFGLKLCVKRNIKFETDEGILSLGNSKRERKGKKYYGHYVVISHGLLFDGRDVWLPKDYFKVHPYYVPMAVLVVDVR